MNPAHSRFSAGERLARFPWLLVWVGLGIYCSFSLWFGIAGLVYPYQLDYGEGIVLWFARQLAHGHSIYKGLSGLPYASSNYPPLGILLAALLMPIFGEGYAAGRLVNFGSALLVAALIYRIVAAETQDRRGGALAALLFLGSPYVFHWIALFRVDLLGLGFAFAGIYAVWKAGREAPGARAERIYLLLALLLFLLALYTKQTLFAAPAAAFFALWRSNRRLAAAYGLALVAIGGGVYLALDYFTGGALSFGLLTSNATVFMPEQLVNLLGNFSVTFPVLLALAFFGLVQRVQRGNINVLDWYAVTSFAALVMAGRTGAWENYFLEAIASACVLAGIALAKWLSTRTPSAHSESQALGGSSLRLALPLLLFAQLALMWADPRIAVDLMAKDFPANQALDALLRNTQGIIISEDMGALATSGKDVTYYTFQYSSLARSGKWDQSWELDGLRDGMFPLVILEHGTREDVDHYRRFTREFVSALDRYYGRVQTIGKYEVYAPAPLVKLQSASFGDSIAMVGWSVVPLSFQPGVVQVTMVWQAQRAMEQRFTPFVHLVNAEGVNATQDDHEPHDGAYPTTRWAAGEMVREVYVLKMPADLPAGKYTVRAGWYDSDSKDRLAVPGSADDSVELMSLVVPSSE